jgi:tetratricopeptide (TPR) repeat protein
MEAAGFVKACMNPYPPIPWYVMRGISDFGDTFKNDRFHNLAAYAVAAYATLYIRNVLDLRIWECIPNRMPRGEPSQPFREENTFNILLLPFDPLEKLPAKEIKPERVILKRLSDMGHEQKLPVQVTLIEDELLLPVTFERGVELGRCHGANLVIWGDYYQSVERNATELALRWALVDPPSLANLPLTGKTPIEAVESLSLLTQGHLQGDIDFVLFWSLSHFEIAAARYQNALTHLETVIKRFGERFPNTMSFRMDERGFSITVNRQGVQLIYYMGHCYQKLGQPEKAITCWDKLLISSGGQKGSSVFVAHLLALAISMGESAEVVRGLLHVLLRKAATQLELQDFKAATKTFQQVYHYADMAKNNPALSGPIFAPVIAWLRDDLKIPEEGAE